MARRPILALVVLALASLACNLPSLSPVRRFTPTPRPGGPPATQGGSAVALPPSETPLGVFGPTPTAGPAGPTETALGGATAAPGTGTATATATATATQTTTATATLTATLSGSATIGPLVISNVQVINVRRDATQPNGAIATVQIFFGGGRGPFQFFDENLPKPGNPFEVDTTCGASLVHTARVTSADGQSAAQPYFATVNCPS
jgi:hypothetical protein